MRGSLISPMGIVAMALRASLPNSNQQLAPIVPRPPGSRCLKCGRRIGGDEKNMCHCNDKKPESSIV